MLKEDQDCAEELDEQLINEEYKIWKKNCPFLYDALITHVLEWPSLSVDWLPSKESRSNCDYTVQKLVIGSHTSKAEQEQLIVASVKLPLEETINAKSVLDNTNEANSLVKAEFKIEPIIRINHDGEPNRIRVMPKHDDLIATKSPSGIVYIYDYTKHPNKSTNGPQLILQGHSKEGFGLSWNTNNQNWLASGSDDHLVCVWDIAAATDANSTLYPYRTLVAHTNIVGDVSWSEFYNQTLASVGDDRKLILWDLRQDIPTHCIDAHIHEINSVDFNKTDENLLATGSSDKTAAIWDIRNMANKLCSLEFHKDSVHSVRWAPFSGTLLGTAGSDRRVLVWDLSRLGDDSMDEDQSEGPPELLFVHGGHTAKVTDISWNMNDQLMMASTAEDNILQVWQMTHALFAPLDIRIDSVDPADSEDL
ncbi:unnamed protein product [Blepharisma stoltei]|uniref:Histone-binding protein RBBP4-like N-terminal domain-containing protein n=1 Tax=Blepharisma stoltei TaxID=1481888 RepID=A0AAU9K6L8_9CILI|nr:unnamed protein product [Blepharisma stoltei]